MIGTGPMTTGYIRAGITSTGSAGCGKNMVDLKRETDMKKIGRKPEDPGRIPKAKFRVFGEEMIEKEVKPSGNTGRVYLPPDWVGKHVKIIRVD
jgi:putative transposon-encoded protein